MNLLRALVFATAGACFAAGCASPPAAGAPPAPAPPFVAAAAHFVGVWTTSTASYDAAARAAEATRLSADGALVLGSWDAKRGFTAAPSAGPSRGFVARYELDLPTRSITFLLDGAEERATLAVDGADRWKTIVTTAEGTVVVHYVRRR